MLAPFGRPVIEDRVAWQRTLDRRAFAGAYAFAAAIETAVCTAAGAGNNFRIYRASFANLVAGRDLYIPHPAQYLDLFKYSPTAALLFAPFAVMPFLPALLAWNLVNTVPLCLAVGRILPPTAAPRALFLVLVAIGLTTDGTQSNGLVAFLIVLALLALERDRPVVAALAIAAGAFLKIFPLAALAFASFHPRPRRFAWIFLLVALGFLALPLAVTSPGTLASQYASWYRVEAVDAIDRGASVMALLQRWAGVTWPNWPIQLAATGLLLVPLAVQRQRRDAAFRLRFLASVLVFVVIFNHQAEQPSFVIALSGIAIWATATPATPLRTALAALVFGLAAPLRFIPASPASWPGAPAPAALAVVALALGWAVMQAELLGVALARSGVAARDTQTET